MDKIFELTEQPRQPYVLTRIDGAGISDLEKEERLGRIITENKKLKARIKELGRND